MPAFLAFELYQQYQYDLAHILTCILVQVARLALSVLPPSRCVQFLSHYVLSHITARRVWFISLRIEQNRTNPVLLMQLKKLLAWNFFSHSDNTKAFAQTLNIAV
jgi:hypothetical protein